jgi:hypothetical protein
VQKFGQQVPMGRPRQPAEIALVCVDLASTQASYVTGHIYGAMGGTGQPSGSTSEHESGRRPPREWLAPPHFLRSVQLFLGRSDREFYESARETVNRLGDPG